MHKVLAASLVLLASSTPAWGQMSMSHGNPKHEFGVDLGVVYTSIGSGCTGSGCSGISIATPVDVRIGLVSSGKLMFEPRFSLSYTTVGGGHTLLFSPDLNVDYAMGPGGNRSGTYLTGGVGLMIADATGGSATQLSLNGGIGTRKAYGSGAFRPQALVRYNFKNSSKGIPSSFDLGVLLGLSLWH